MTSPADPLILELLAWISARPRTYAEAMETWRSSCPRHPAWEDALADGLVAVDTGEPMERSRVTLTSRGRAVLDGKPDN